MFDTNLPRPIRPREGTTAEYECICRRCRASPDPLHSWVWNVCKGCGSRIWYDCGNCSLYSRRGAAKLICFNCREPYYKKGMNMGQIMRVVIQ